MLYGLLNKKLLNKTLSSLFLSLFFFFLAFPSKAISTQGGISPNKFYLPNDPVAEVNGETITLEAVRKEIIKNGLGMGKNLDSLDKRLKILDELISFKVFVQQAQKMGYEQKSNEESSMKEMVKIFLNDVLSSEMGAIKVSEEEIKEYYKSNIEEFSSPELRRACVIYVKIPKDASKEQIGKLKKRAKEAFIHAKQQSPSFTSFGTLASKYSDHKNSKNRGGDLGWLRKDEEKEGIDSHAMEAIFSLKRKGMLSELIKTDHGFYIIKLIDKRPSARQGLSKVKGYIEEKLLDQKKQEIIMQYYKKIKKDYEIIIHKDVLQAIELIEDTTSPPPYPVGAHRNYSE